MTQIFHMPHRSLRVVLLLTSGVVGAAGAAPAWAAPQCGSPEMLQQAMASVDLTTNPGAKATPASATPSAPPPAVVASPSPASAAPATVANGVVVPPPVKLSDPGMLPEASAPIPPAPRPVAEGMPAPATPVPAPAATSTTSSETDAAALAPGKHELTDAEIAALPGLQRIHAAGAHIFDIGLRHGLRGYYTAIAGVGFQTFYLTPDNQGVVGGMMWDAGGKNITREQEAGIPGLIPTVTIGPAEAQTAAAQPAGQTAQGGHPAVPSLLKAVEGTAYGVVGAENAPRLWMFIDPECAWSKKGIAQLAPYIKSGRLQLAVIPIAVLDAEAWNHGKSTAAALTMLSQPHERMVGMWANNHLPAPAAGDSAAGPQLMQNMTIAARINLQGTPTFIWRNADGSEGRVDGLPGNIDTLVAEVTK